MPHEAFGWSGMWGFPLMPIIFIIFIAVCLLMMFRGGMMCGSRHGQGHREGEPESSLEILKKRYARGEITKEEFEEMKKGIE
ncbi:MAG: SHOCT domain-containing protein [Thermodesulfobacteriota bacterium]